MATPSRARQKSAARTQAARTRNPGPTDGRTVTVRLDGALLAELHRVTPLAGDGPRPDATPRQRQWAMDMRNQFIVQIAIRQYLNAHAASFREFHATGDR